MAKASKDAELRPRIKRCQAKDARAFLRLEAICFEMRYRNEVVYYWRPVFDYGWTFKVICDGRIVGGVIAMPTRQGMVYINSLFVHPLRNRGIARRLLKRVLRLRTPKGFVLDVKTEKRYLISFYEKEGFRIARKEANYYLDGSARVIMTKDS